MLTGSPALTKRSMTRIKIQDLINEACESLYQTVIEQREDASRKALSLAFDYSEMVCIHHGAKECAEQIRKMREKLLSTSPIDKRAN